MRRYLWSSLSYKDDPFEYTGRGLELFLGFLIVLVLVVAPLMGVYFTGYWLAKSGRMLVGFSIMGGIYLVMFALFGAAIYRVLTYRLSRTKWRGIRAALDGSSFGYAARYVAGVLLQVVTLGFATPYVAIMLYRYMLNNVWFGSGRLRFDADWKPLLKYYVLPGLLRLGALGLLLLVGFTMEKATPEHGTHNADLVLKAVWIGLAALSVLLLSAIAMFWYRAAVIRAVFAGLDFEGVRFAAPVRGGRLCGFMVANYLLVVFTQYIAYPWVQLRVLRFAAGIIEIHGEPDFSMIGQNTALQPRFGEGLGEAFL